VVYAVLALLAHFTASPSRWRELGMLIAASALWFLLSAAVLKLTGSTLPQQFLSRFSRPKTA
ncbi:MAG TPA: hypothetical protein VFR08_15980, partial [Candidatus Angelobacter sp.]|nr:hypothetical protein [Candidatus Angelobacter sp.]